MFILFLLLALALALSYAFPQTPAYVRSDPNTYQEWLSTIQVQYKDWTPFLEGIGIFNIHDTSWFRVLLALTMLVLLVSLAEHASALARSFPVRRPVAFYDMPETAPLAVVLSAAETADRLEQALSELGLRTRRQATAGVTHMQGQRAQWAAAAVLMVYIGGVLLIAAMGVNGRWGWRQEDVHLLPDTPVPLGPGGLHDLELADAQPFENGARVRIAGDQVISLMRGRTTYRGTHSYDLTDQTGPWVQVSAQRGDHTPLALSEYTVRPEPRDVLHFTFAAASSQEDTDRLFLVPDEKLVIRLEWLNRDCTDPSRCPRPELRQWVFDQGGQNLLGQAQVEAADGLATTQIGGINYLWRVAQYVVVDVAYQPGRWMLGAGLLCLAVGLLGTMMPHQQVWCVVNQSETGVEIRMRTTFAGFSSRWRQRYEHMLSALRADIGSP